MIKLIVNNLVSFVSFTLIICKFGKKVQISELKNLKYLVEQCLKTIKLPFFFMGITGSRKTI